MKKVKMLLSGFAFVFAIVAAFAFKPADVELNAVSFKPTSGPCRAASMPQGCSITGTRICDVTIDGGESGEFHKYDANQTVSCANLLEKP